MGKRLIKYKSKFEESVAAFYGSQVVYEPSTIPFLQPEKKRKYLPDFGSPKFDNFYLETKGKLTLQDRQKHIWIKEQHPEITIVFIFQNAGNRITRRSNTTYADWAEANGFPWYCWKTKQPPTTIKELAKCILTKPSSSLEAPSPLAVSFQTKKSTS